MTVADVLAQIAQDRIFYDDSGGGVTFSGGEPLSQPSFLEALLRACASEGIHTAVDTSGCAPPADLLAIVPLTGLFLYDLKSVDETKHREYTGVSNERILCNLITLGRVHPRIWVRMPVIPGFNAANEEMSALARFVASIPAVEQVNLLPYHRIGIPKLRRLGYSEQSRELVLPSTEQMEQARRCFEDAGVVARVGG